MVFSIFFIKSMSRIEWNGTLEFSFQIRKLQQRSIIEFQDQIALVMNT